MAELPPQADVGGVTPGPSVRPIAALTKAEAAYAEVRGRILDGSLEPGSELNQDSLARALGVSITPLREALRRLEGEGLVRVRGTKGMLVVPLTVREFEELWAVRMKLDPFAACLAAEGHDSSSPAGLSALANIPRADNDLDAWHAAHYTFHHAIWEASHNLVLVETLERLWQRMERYRFATLSGRDTSRASPHAHQEIAQAIERGDAGAAAALTVHHLQAAQSARTAP